MVEDDAAAGKTFTGVPSTEKRTEETVGNCVSV
jgi:hypothetical protein